MTPAGVVEQFPHLTRAGVHAALAYYWSRPDEIHRAIEAGDRLVEELKARYPSRLADKLAEIARTDVPDPPLPSG